MIMTVSMRWKKMREQQPSDQQEVLIRERSIVQLAIFVEASNSFQLKNGSSVPVNTDSIQWLELVNV